MRKELSRDERRKQTWKMWSFDCFPGEGFSLGGNHKQSKGDGIQLLPNFVFCENPALFSSLGHHLKIPIQPLLASHPLDHLMSKGREQFNSWLMNLLV